MKHIIQMSSGVASAYAAHLVINRHGPNNVTLLFADVTNDNGEWWEGEDPDNYRFLNEITQHLNVPLITVKDGRGVWGVAQDQNMIPNNRVPFCSRILKQEPCRQWITTNCDPTDTTLHIGIDLTEIHRCDAITHNWAPWTVDYPLLWKPYALKTDAFNWLKTIGINRPRMYDEGFQHANCAGACVRMGNGAAEHLYHRRPEVFAALEARENAMRDQVGDYSILTDRRGGQRRPYPLKELRIEIEARETAAPRLFTDMTCGRCFE